MTMMGDNGAVSALANRIFLELRAQLGKNNDNFKLWRDKDALAKGEHWKEKLKEAVSESVFFIQMVTPSALNCNALWNVTWDWPKFRGFNDPFLSTTAVALIGAVIVNYLSLWKTRFVLTRAGSLQNAFVATAVVIGDFLATTVIFAVFYYLVFIDLFIPLFVHFQCPDCDREITFIRLLMGHEQRLPFR